MDYKFTATNILVVTTNAGGKNRAIFGPFEYTQNNIKASSALFVFTKGGGQEIHHVAQLVLPKTDPMYCVVAEFAAQQKRTHENLGPVDASDIADISNDDQVIRFLARRIWDLVNDSDAPDGVKEYTLVPIKGG